MRLPPAGKADMCTRMIIWKPTLPLNRWSRVLFPILLASVWPVERARSAEGTKPASNQAKFPCDAEVAARYTAYRVSETIKVDGKLEEKAWQGVARSPRFVDILTGKPTMYDTRTAVLWDDENLYVAFWVEEPNVAATLT